MNEKEYSYIVVESYIPKNTSGLRGTVHIRPIPGKDPYLHDMHVQCSKTLSYDYPVGTKFRIKAKIVYPVNGNKPFVSSHYTFDYEILKRIYDFIFQSPSFLK